MSTVAEGLVLALRSLPKADKARVISHLWEDRESREAMTGLLIRRLLEFQGNQNGEKPLSPANDNSVKTNLTSKERGKRLREGYISELQQDGIQINQVDSVWAKTVGGLWVAIPTATMEWRPGRWFLGLPEDRVLERINKGGVVIVLLCQSASGSRLDFVIPGDTVQEIVPKLSKSAGQLKFNLKKVGNRYQLVMPGSSPLDVSDCTGMVSIFQS